MTQVGFQGEPGAFGDTAARRFGEPVPFESFEAVVTAVAAGVVDAGVLPVENTLAGTVQRATDALLASDLRVVGEVVVRVRHVLWARPGARLEDVRRVFSHPVALAQCERFFQQYRGLTPHVAADTAGAVREVLGRGNLDEAAIAGPDAGPRWGAVALAEGIESDPANFTRFLLVSRDGTPMTIPGSPRTGVVFRLRHQPGALALALAAFADEGIDLTRIVSRPIEGRPWSYDFVVDAEGRHDDPGLIRALARLAALTERLRVLGSWSRDPLGGS